MCRVELPPMGFSAARSSQALPKALHIGHLSSPILLRGFQRACKGIDTPPTTTQYSEVLHIHQTVACRKVLASTGRYCRLALQQQWRRGALDSTYETKREPAS